MSNPSGPDEPTDPGRGEATADAAPATEVFSAAEPTGDDDAPERRFTAPSAFDAGHTQIIETAAEPATEIFSVPGTHDGPNANPITAAGPVAPQVIPGRGDTPKPARRRRSWGWVIALVLVIAALAAVAILGTVLLTRHDAPAVSQEQLVRTAIMNFDGAIQTGDLSTLRSITCGETAVGYNEYPAKQWKDTHARVYAAEQYPVVASIDQVVVRENHAEANVTTFMASDPSMTSTRSFDLEFRDEQWKICQAAQ